MGIALAHCFLLFALLFLFCALFSMISNGSHDPILYSTLLLNLQFLSQFYFIPIITFLIVHM